MTILVIAEHDNVKLKPSTRNVITAAQQLTGPIHVAVLGNDCQQVAEEAAKCQGVETVYLAQDPQLAHSIAEAWVPTLNALGFGSTYILAPASTFGKNLIPRLASSLEVAPLTDVMVIENDSTFIRPIYAGNALATVRCSEPIKVMTIRPTAFEKCDGGATIQQVPFVAPTTPVPKFVSLEESKSERPELAADVVVSGGRGLQSKENFKILEQLADQLNAAIGASRAAVDAGFVPNDYQVGQTGNSRYSICDSI